MVNLRWNSFTTATLLAAAVLLSGCGKSPSAPPLARIARPATAAPAVTTAPAVQPLPAAPTAPETVQPSTGKLSLQLSGLQAPGIAGVGIEITGPGLAEPIGQILTPDDLKTSNTLVFEHLPAGALKARVVAFDENEEVVNETSQAVEVPASQEAKMALQLSAQALETGNSRVEFKFVSPEALTATTPLSTAGAIAGDTPTSTPRSTAPLSKALKLEIIDQQTVRKFLLLKRAQITIRVTNENPTETLKGEVKVDFLKVKGLVKRNQEVVQTLTAPINSLAPGRSVEITLTSTVSAEDAEATVHTVLASDSASTQD
jgi:hypothetical protein